MSATHKLKTHPRYWDASAAGQKTFEVRKNDRFFQRGDIVELLKWEPTEQRYIRSDGDGYTVYEDDAATLRFRIGPLLQGGQFGIESGYCVFSVLPVESAA